MRHSIWNGPMISLALVACVEDRRLVSETDPVGVSDAALSERFDPLICTLRHECARWGELIVEPAAEASECAPLEGSAQPPAWHETIDGIPCPFGSCSALDVQLASEPAGSLLAMFRVELPSPMARGREAGLWLTRYEADASHAGSQLWDFAIPPPGVEVQRHAQLLSDASGDAVLASARAVLPGDAARPLTIAKIGGRDQPKVPAPSATTPASRAERSAIGPNDEVLVVSVHAQRSVLTLHDRHGKVLWNRPWPASEGLTAINSMQMDGAGRITAQVWTYDELSGEGGTTIARLDRQGRVVWQRSIADASAAVQSTVDDDGNVYALSTTWGFDALEVRLERIDRRGRSTAAWSLGQLGFWPELHRGRGGVWITNRDELSVEPELSVFSFGAHTRTSDACEGRRYAWPGTWDDFLNDAIVLTESKRSEVYIATNRILLKLEGGAP